MLQGVRVLSIHLFLPITNILAHYKCDLETRDPDLGHELILMEPGGAEAWLTCWAVLGHTGHYL